MLALALLLAVELADPFGEAAAAGRQLSAQVIEVDVTVTVTGGGSVVAHLIDPGDQERTVAMAARGGETYGTVFETAPSDLVVVFEVVGDEGSTLSEPVSLTQLGLDPALVGQLPGGLAGVGDDSGQSETVRRWGWLGLALGAASLSLLAVWALGGRDRSRGEPDSGGEVADEPAVGETDSGG